MKFFNDSSRGLGQVGNITDENFDCINTVLNILVEFSFIRKVLSVFVQLVYHIVDVYSPFNKAVDHEAKEAHSDECCSNSTLTPSSFVFGILSLRSHSATFNRFRWYLCFSDSSLFVD